MINIDFSAISSYSNVQMNHWEIEYLKVLKYNVNVHASYYAKLYFEFRQDIHACSVPASSIEHTRDDNNHERGAASPLKPFSLDTTGWTTLVDEEPAESTPVNSPSRRFVSFKL